MSSQLYRFGREMVRHRRVVLTLWLVVLALAAGIAGMVQKGTDDSVHIPGASSVEALTQLRHVFPELSGTSAQLVVVAAPGHRIGTPAARADVAATVRELAKAPDVVLALDPFDPGTRDAVSADGRAALIDVHLSVDLLHVSPATRAQIQRATDRLRERVTASDSGLGAGATVYLGGDAFGDRVPHLSLTEGVGLLVALVVLVAMFGSMIAAGLPVVTALLGVGVSMSGIYAATAVTPIMSTAPMLAVMLGLAVGIDYALFVLSRHRDQLAAGLDVEESVARATATAGSAVVVAGLTVVIALLGLFVAGVPFLTTMGVAAVSGVGIAVLVALTAMPALIAVAGERLRPRRPRPFRPHRAHRAHRSRRASGTPAGPDRSPSTRHPIARRWVALVTARPLVTVLAVTLGLGICALPATNLHLSLPDNGTLDPGNPSRAAYDAVNEHFGPGFNAPLLITLDVLPSTDPVTLTRRIADEVRGVPGVLAVPLATPNRSGDTAVIEIIPTSAGDSRQTDDLTRRLRDLLPGIKARYGVDGSVTGMTAVTIDISQRLGAALLPFGILVVGLSVVLLAMVFRSVAVPVKAALGYLLSVGAALGATSWVFGSGHLAGPLRVQHVGSEIAFLPIIVMGVLFGLAMDYEMFLVSRMREHYVHHGDAAAAIREGFCSAAAVVTAAALIMTGVFAAFVPQGSSSVKPIAFALAVGVLADAFGVRMTLVPAVLALLGNWAWWLPARLDRRLPAFDVEGEGLLRELRLGDLPVADDGSPEIVVAAHDLVLRDGHGRTVVDAVSFTVRRGQVLVVAGGGCCGRSALLLALGGRLGALCGDLTVGGRVLPYRRRQVRRAAALIACRDGDPVPAVRQALGDRVDLLLLDDLDVVVHPGVREELHLLLAGAGAGPGAPAVVVSCADAGHLADVLAGLTAEVLALPASPPTDRACPTDPTDSTDPTDPTDPSAGASGDRHLVEA